MRILVLGISGMLGNAVFRFLAGSPSLEVQGSARSREVLKHFSSDLRSRVACGVDVESTDSLEQLVRATRPQVVINCIGVVKQLAAAGDPLSVIPINSLLPHRLARLCEPGNARLLHVSTDCVFAGSKGNYQESDLADAQDLYGRSKLLGEVDYPHAITLRTSIIGHELDSAHGLIGWFLSQKRQVRGYTRAIFSGLPTVELARVIRDFVLPNAALHGVFHVAAAPISKYELLRLVALEYGKAIEIVPDDAVVIDRSLNGGRFREATAYVAPPWPALVAAMRAFG